jgi:hypothetical protein
MKRITWSRGAAMSVVAGVLLGVWSPLKIDAQDEAGKQAVDTLRFQVDPFWPKPLPDRWVTGEFGGVCVDAQDHVFVVQRGDLTPQEETSGATAAPPIIEFDPDGNVANSWGNPDLMPKVLHGCFVDYQGNFWIAGDHDAIVQKYTHDGSKMLLQIGIKGKFDSADFKDSRVIDGRALNSSHELLNSPTQVAVDPANGDVYIADGYGNRRVAVFDREGHYLRQWGRQGTLAEEEAGVGGTFMKQVHCVAIGNDGLVYVCDPYGHRIEVFDKAGNFRRNYTLVESKSHPSKVGGRTNWFGFSPDRAQKLMYVGDCGNNQIRVLDRATGQELSSFGRPGTQLGEFECPHTLAVDSKSNIIVGDNYTARRIQMWRLVR